MGDSYSNVNTNDNATRSVSNRISVKEDFLSYNKYKDVHEFEEYVDILPAYQHATEGLHLINGLRGQQRLKYSPMYYSMQISLFM